MAIKLSATMAEIPLDPPQLSVNILLPEALNRRLERRTERMPGASWPAWGGHITLVPNFVPRGTVEEVRALIESVCADEESFLVRTASPIALQDTTRPDYYAAFLTVEDVLESEERLPIHALRKKLLLALEPLREDVRPQLLEQPFLPHVTLALGVGESEAAQLVQAMRAQPVVAEFRVDEIWLLAQTFGATARIDRYLIALGHVAPAELLRD